MDDRIFFCPKEHQFNSRLYLVEKSDNIAGHAFQLHFQLSCKEYIYRDKLSICASSGGVISFI